LTIDPVTTSTLYAKIASDDGLLYKSTNGGQTWHLANAGLPKRYLYFLVIDPGAPTTLYAGTWDGLFRSTDGGDHWNSMVGVEGEVVVSLVIDPATPTIMYAGTSRGVETSTDGGNYWSAINTGLSSRFVKALVLDPVTHTILYGCSDGGGMFVINISNH
jgi:photosystem II stability/assembly factor-like uncharacterized protein